MINKLVQERGKPKTQVSLILLIKDGRVLLGRKKHAFAHGKWNGPGGKQDPEEMIEECALRELEGESGLIANKTDLIKVGEVDFYFSEKEKWDQTVHTYLITRDIGEPKEISDEIGDWKWYPFQELPLDEMWSADRLWWPQILNGKKLKAQFVYSPGEKEGENIITYSNLEEIQDF